MSSNEPPDRFACVDCHVDTSHRGISEYYHVHDRIWRQVTTPGEPMLCIGCLEARLGRELTSGDFTGAPVNHIWPSQSDRLRNRIGDG